MSSAYTVSATEIGDMQNSYTTLSVEFSDNIGQNEDLDIFVKDEHVYANAEQLGERLGYQVEVGKDYAAVYNKQFSNSVPYGLTTFYYDSKKVGHMLFNKMVDYEAPIETIKNDDGAWIPLEFSLLLLNSSDVVLDNQVHIEMPQKNIVDLYMDVLKNNDRYLFDWKNDAGASDGAIFAMGSSAYIVQLFNGVLDTDGASWLQLMNGFCSNTDIYDAKYAQDFAKMFCTYSDEEINQSVSDIKETLKPFNGDNWVIKSIKKIGDLYDDKIGELSKISEDLKTKIDAENKASMIAYNKSYQEFEKLYDRADFFYDATDPFVLASDKVKDATSFLDVYYSISQIVGYASEFNNQDKFAMESLDTLINNSGSQSIMSQNMKNSMKDYKDTLETDVVSYSAYNYLMDNMGDWLTDALDVSSTILDAKSKALLLAWSLSKGTMPFYKNGLSNTDCFLQSMYAGVVQADTMNMYITKRNDVFSDSKNITPEKLYELSKYCYAYLKSCYITRDAAVGSLTEKTKKDNPTYASTQEMVNKEIASCLVKLKNADKNNKYGCYGFLPEDNDKYLEEFDDSSIMNCVGISSDGEELYKDILDMYYYKIKNQNWTDNDDVSIAYLYNENYKELGNTGYAFIDIDGNGVPELLIGDKDSENDGRILDLYTCIDNQIVHLGTTWERFGISLSKNGRIYQYGSGGARLTSQEECVIDVKNKALSVVDAVIYDEDDAQSTPWFHATEEYGTDSGFDLSKMKNISEEEGMKKWEEYNNNIIGYSINPFSEYTPKEGDSNIKSRAYYEFLKNREYKTYIGAEWNNTTPAYYAIFDIDGNGVDELLLYGTDNSWSSMTIFTLDVNTQKITIIPGMEYDTDSPYKIDVLSTSGEFYYSQKYHAIAYNEYRSLGYPYEMSYYTIQNNVLDYSFDMWSEENADTGELNYYIAGIDFDKKELTKEEADEYRTEYTTIFWKPIP